MQIDIILMLVDEMFKPNIKIDFAKRRITADYTHIFSVICIQTFSLEIARSSTSFSNTG
jgi:hypothetical protein